MNGANQESPGATYHEAQTSKRAAASSKQEGKMPLGIKAKLFLAFGGMALLTCGASAIGR
jgi:hypothetical protein